MDRMPDIANTAMGRYWNEVAGPRWVERAGLQEARNIEVAHLLQQAAAPLPGERVLDIGCGTGGTTAALAKAVGPAGHVDPDRRHLEAVQLTECLFIDLNADAAGVDEGVIDVPEHEQAGHARTVSGHSKPPVRRPGLR